jgi:hypothetical protein
VLQSLQATSHIVTEFVLRMLRGCMKESAIRKQNALVFSEYERVKEFTIWIKRGTMLSGSTVTTAWHVLGLWIEETASRYEG